MNKLRLMSLFVHIVECGSISKAADRLELSKSVLSAALKQLEQELETCLLKRTTRTQTLTSAGERFYLQCALMTKQAEAAWLEASKFKQVPAGKLTVTAPHALMRTVVVPALTTAFAGYPDAHLNLISDDKHVDITQQGIDLAVRVGASRDSSLKQRKVGQFCDLLCAAKSQGSVSAATPYIAQHWQIEPIVHRFLRGDDVEEIPFNIKHRSNTVFDVVFLLELGLGIGIVPDFIIRSNARLFPVQNALPVKKNPIYTLHPYQSHPPIAVTLAIEAVEMYINDAMPCQD